MRSTRQLSASRLAVDIDDFVIPVGLGSVAGFLAGMGARALMNGDHDKTKEAFAHIAHAAAFWIVGGLAFVLRQRRPHG
ncbi:MAG: hypothetical protein JO277_08860 [Candidatus Eremiobacteraeota bacterium]|nr:hypothetical protein [Candidatus Eremiobacteraeota bacterium]